METYEDVKKDLDDFHSSIMDMFRSNLKQDRSLLVLIIVAIVCCAYVCVYRFCKGDVGIFVVYSCLLGVNIVSCVETLKRRRRIRDNMKAQEWWYESELNRLNNWIKESEDNECRNE